MSKLPISDEEEALLRAMMESAAMDEMRDYLLRGRIHAELSDAALQVEWTKSFKRWFTARDLPQEQEMNDFSAELRLRKIEPPYEGIKAESEKMLEEIWRERHYDAGVRAEIEKFRADLRERKN
jgi:hypothetical protein